MADLNTLHNEAMDDAERALLAKLSGDTGRATDLFQKAFESERHAAEMVGEPAEPSRGILCRSAASLALSAGLHREAERMIAFGLLGDPPGELAEELRDLLEQVHFERHLKLRDVVLGEDELQLSLSGPEAGHGIVKGDEFIKRIVLLEKLSYRTAERKLGREFRQAGRISRDIRETCEPYFSVPRAASFAVTVRFGTTAKNFQLFEDIPTRAVIDDMVDNLELLNAGQMRELQERIPDDRYFNNFLGLAKKMSPDLKNVSLVGFTRVRDKEEKDLAFTRTSAEIRIPRSLREEAHEEAEPVKVVGIMDFASARETEVHLTDTRGTIYVVVVPRGVLADIVRPYWGQTVRIHGQRAGNRIYFEDIEEE